MLYRNRAKNPWKWLSSSCVLFHPDTPSLGWLGCFQWWCLPTSHNPLENSLRSKGLVYAYSICFSIQLLWLTRFSFSIPYSLFLHWWLLSFSSLELPCVLCWAFRERGCSGFQGIQTVLLNILLDIEKQCDGLCTCGLIKYFSKHRPLFCLSNCGSGLLGWCLHMEWAFNVLTTVSISQLVCRCLRGDCRFLQSLIALFVHPWV